MARIRVTPENLDCLAVSLRDKSRRLFDMVAEINRAYFNIDWEIREKIQRSADVKNAEARARRLSEDLLRMAEFLSVKAQAFEAADPPAAFQLNLTPVPPPDSLPMTPTNPLQSNRYNEENWDYMQTWPLYKNGTTHTGIDIRPKNPDDTSITPIGPGEVYEVGTSTGGYGHYIVIKHTLADGREVFSKYAHLQERPNFSQGDKILDTNTSIGIMGNSGTEAPHLHLEVTNKYPPAFYLNGKNPENLYSPNGPSYLDQLKKDYLNPVDVLNGNLGWEFKAPPNEG